MRYLCFHCNDYANNKSMKYMNYFLNNQQHITYSCVTALKGKLRANIKPAIPQQLVFFITYATHRGLGPGLR